MCWSAMLSLLLLLTFVFLMVNGWVSILLGLSFWFHELDEYADASQSRGHDQCPDQWGSGVWYLRPRPCLMTLLPSACLLWQKMISCLDCDIAFLTDFPFFCLLFLSHLVHPVSNCKCFLPPIFILSCHLLKKLQWLSIAPQKNLKGHVKDPH